MGLIQTVHFASPKSIIGQTGQLVVCLAFNLGVLNLNLNLNSLLVKRQIDNPSPGAVTGGN